MTLAVRAHHYFTTENNFHAAFISQAHDTHCNLLTGSLTLKNILKAVFLLKHFAVF